MYNFLDYEHYHTIFLQIQKYKQKLNRNFYFFIFLLFFVKDFPPVEKKNHISSIYFVTIDKV